MRRICLPLLVLLIIACRPQGNTLIGTIGRPQENELQRIESATVDLGCFQLIPNRIITIPQNLGTDSVSSKKVSFTGFNYMGKFEVTNWEYFTFLDHLRQTGDTSSYWRYKPDSILWEEPCYLGGLIPPGQMYHWHPAYDSYPVLNISYEGATVYCEWLQSKLKAQLDSSTSTKYEINVRLPHRYEWLNAAIGWEDSLITNTLNLPHHKRKPTRDDKKLRKEYGIRYGYRDSCYPYVTADYPVSTISDSSYLQSLYHCNYPFESPQRVNYGYPNLYGCYNMCGNVREMVLKEPEDSLIYSMGGSWFDAPDKLNVFNYQTDSPKNCFTGFRVFISVYKREDKKETGDD